MRSLALIFAFTVITITGGPAAADTAPEETLQSPLKLAEQARASIRELSPAELSALLKTNRDLLLVDVRTEREYQAGHLRGANWIPRGKLEFAIGRMQVSADHEIVLYCRSGSRAALGARALQDMGYTNVSSMAGGFKQWALGGNSIYNRHGEMRVLDFEASEADQ